MMAARREDFSDKSSADRVPPEGARRGWEIIRNGGSKYIGGATPIHIDTAYAVSAFSAQVSGIDQARPIGFQFGGENVFSRIEAVRMRLRGVKSRKIV